MRKNILYNKFYDETIKNNCRVQEQNVEEYLNFNELIFIINYKKVEYFLLIRIKGICIKNILLVSFFR